MRSNRETTSRTSRSTASIFPDMGPETGEHLSQRRPEYPNHRQHAFQHCHARRLRPRANQCAELSPTSPSPATASVQICQRRRHRSPSRDQRRHRQQHNQQSRLDGHRCVRDVNTYIRQPNLQYLRRSRQRNHCVRHQQHAGSQQSQNVSITNNQIENGDRGDRHRGRRSPRDLRDAGEFHRRVQCDHDSANYGIPDWGDTNTANIYGNIVCSNIPSANYPSPVTGQHLQEYFDL